MTLGAPPVGDGAIWSAWLAAFHAPALAIADELGLFGGLAVTPRTVAELATVLDIEERATEALCGVLTSLGFLEIDDGRLALTEVARIYLLPESPYYWGGMLRRIRENPLDVRPLIQALRRGRAAAEARLSEMWRAPMPPPEALVAFTHAMHAHSFALAMRTVHRMGLDGATSLLDVGGGSGSYSIAAALRHPALCAAVLDLAPVCGVAGSFATQYGVADRVSTVAADMFAGAWPTGHDRILLADILHDWDDQRCAALVAAAFEALPHGGKLLVHEMLLSDDKHGPGDAMTYSLVMVFRTEGKQRSGSELRALFEAAGFISVRITPTENSYSFVEGVRP